MRRADHVTGNVGGKLKGRNERPFNYWPSSGSGSGSGAGVG